MKSVTTAVILAGLITYWGGVAAPTVPVKSAGYISEVTGTPPLYSDPDDDEDENRVRSRLAKRKA